MSDPLMNCVDAFAEAMKEKLNKKRGEGWTGWQENENYAGIKESLVYHATVKGIEGEEVDIANLSMMIWNLNGRPRL
jgi:hypothetical protein